MPYRPRPRRQVQLWQMKRAEVCDSGCGTDAENAKVEKRLSRVALRAGSAPVFLGATPETLLFVREQRVETHALAGTAHAGGGGTAGAPVTIGGNNFGQPGQASSFLNEKFYGVPTPIWLALLVLLGTIAKKS